jgi:hypothetical protein
VTRQRWQHLEPTTKEAGGACDAARDAQWKTMLMLPRSSGD